jgi:hypothetical protein
MTDTPDEARNNKGFVVDLDNLPSLYPTHRHSSIFWETLSRTVATFGFLEEVLGKAIFAFTATKHYPDSEIEAAYQRWLPTLERALIDPLGNLIDAYGKAARDNTAAWVENLDTLLVKLREASVIRNVLCHGSWRAPDASGRSLPLFVNKQTLVWDTPIDLAFLNQTQKAVAELACTVVSTVTSLGWQFPGSNGPGQVIFDTSASRGPNDNSKKFEIKLYFVDTTYGKEGDQWEAQSGILRAELEAEYRLPLQNDDIGPGWSFPVFAATITEYWPVAAALVALFLSGEKIEKNIDAWPRLYDRLKRFLTRPVYLDTRGASVLAMNAVIVKYGKPSSLTMTGYTAWSAMEGEPPRDTTPIVGRDAPPARKHLSTTIHIFQITADDKSFKVFVSGSDVQVIDMPSAGGTLTELT